MIATTAAISIPFTAAPRSQLAPVAAAQWDVGDAQPGGQPGVLGVGVSEHTAVLVDGDSGVGTLVGVGPAHSLRTQPPHGLA